MSKISEKLLKRKKYKPLKVKVREDLYLLVMEELENLENNFSEFIEASMKSFLDEQKVKHDDQES